LERKERNFMPKAASSTAKGTSSSKKPAASKSRARTAHSAEPALPAPTAPEMDTLPLVLQRLETLEEKITTGFTTLADELRALKATPAESASVVESLAPLMGDWLRQSLPEHLNPLAATLKRLEERIGFVANRLKHGGGGGGQERQKPWRQEQNRHARPPRGLPQNGQRPNQGQPQPWTPPSAASVQGHFAPRPLPGGGFVEEED
jgi:hypothetical protein